MYTLYHNNNNIGFKKINKTQKQFHNKLITSVANIDIPLLLTKHPIHIVADKT